MYKVEIKFDSSKLTQSDMDRICEQTDQIFEKEDASKTTEDFGQLYSH